MYHCLGKKVLNIARWDQLLINYFQSRGEDINITFSITIIIRKGWQCKAGRERLTPYIRPKTPAQQYQLIE